MSHVGYVYVPSESKANFATGLANRVWGWRSSALDRADARSQLAELADGDFLVLGHRGPNSRVKAGGWSEARLERVVVGRIVRPLYTDLTDVWPDDVYPERVDLDFLYETQNAQGSLLGPEAMEALRLSANKQGVAVLAEIGTLINLVVTGGSEPDNGIEADDPDAGELLGMDGELDVISQSLVRREQRKLRLDKFGRSATLPCDMCGRLLPRAMVRAAHIKRRSKCTPIEQRTRANIMAACTSGCDDLFEYGYVYVDDKGVIRSSPRSGVTRDLRQLAERLSGNVCGAFTKSSAPFFAWHAENVAK